MACKSNPTWGDLEKYLFSASLFVDPDLQQWVGNKSFWLLNVCCFIQQSTQLTVISVSVRYSGSPKYCRILNSYSRVSAYASLSYCQWKDKLFRKVIQSNKVRWILWQAFFTQMYTEPAEIICINGIFSNLLVMRRNISPSTFCPVNSARQSNYST